MRKSILIILLILVGHFGLKAQGAWNKQKGDGFFKLSEMIIVSDHFYTPEGSVERIKTAGVYMTNIYAEYGLTDKLTAVAFVPFFVRNTINEQQFTNSPNVEPGDESNDFGDVDIAFQYGIKQEGPLALSASLLFGLPTGETSGGESGILQSGDGEFNQLIRLHAGYSFYPAPYYIQGSIGFNNRTNDFSDEFRLAFEAGVTINTSLFVAMKFGVLESFNNGDAANSQTGIFSNNTEYITLGPEVSYLLSDNFGISGSVFGALRGQNILASPAFNLGVVYNLTR